MDSRAEAGRPGGLSGRAVDRATGRTEQSYSENDDEFDNVPLLSTSLRSSAKRMVKMGMQSVPAQKLKLEVEPGKGRRVGATSVKHQS